MEPKCMRCKYFDPIREPVWKGADGFCRCNPPAPCETGDLWPCVGAKDWCGRYEARDEGAEP